MAEIRTRIVINEGREGIPLHKLADVAKEAERFFECLGADCHLPDSQDKWLALNFANGSLKFDVAYYGSSTAEQVVMCKKNLRAIISETAKPRRAEDNISYKTLTHFANLSLYLDAGENISFGIYKNGEADPVEWSHVSQQKLTSLRDSLMNEVISHGAIHGSIHAIVRDHKRPYVEIRDSETKLLVKCYYKPAHYESIVAALKPHDATIHIAGEMTISRHDGKIECMSIEQFKKTSPRDPDALKRFFGCVSNVTGGRISTEAAIAKVRHG